MTVTEESRNDLYEGLTKVLGKQRANTLMEHLPPRGWGDIATKQDLRELRSDMRTEMADLRTELKTEMADLRTELKTEMGELRTEIGVGFADMRAELHKTLRVHTLAVVAIVATLMAVFGSVMRLTG